MRRAPHPHINDEKQPPQGAQKGMSSMAKQWRKVGAAIIGVAAAAAFSGCGGQSSGSEGGLAGKRVTLVTCPTSNAICSSWSSNTEKALEAKGVEVTVYTQNFDAAQEVQLLNQAISARPDLIILHETADSKAVVPVISTAKQRGVPIISVDGRAEDAAVSSLTSQVIHDNVKLGQFAAQNIISGLQEAGKKSGNVIAITGTASSLITQDRTKGFTAEMAKYPQYKVVATEDGNWDPVKSGQLAQQLFAKFSGDIDAAYGMADYQAIPIVQAARQAGVEVGAKNGGLIVTGSNCTGAGVQNVRSGAMHGTGTEDPPTLAKYTADAAEKFLSGEELPAIVWVPVQRITGDNVSEFMERCSY